MSASSPPTAILTGTIATIDPGVLAGACEDARERRHRLVVVDEDFGLAAACADPLRDLHYDADRGNWDFFADHQTEMGRAIACDAILLDRRPPSPVRDTASCALFGILDSALEPSDADLGQIAMQVRAFGYEDLVREIRVLDRPSPGAGYLHAVIDKLHEDAGRFAAHDPNVDRLSIDSWYAGDPSAILFVTAHAPIAAMHDGACRSVLAFLSAVKSHADARSVPVIGISPSSAPGRN